MNANRTPDEIEADINDVRERMDSTLDTLEQRLDAKRLLREGLEHFRNSEAIKYATTAAVSAGRAARDHPVPAALAGAGLLGLIVWGMRSSHSRTERKAMRNVSEAVDTARDRLMNAKSALAESARGASGWTRDAAGRAWHEIEHAGSEARSTVRKHPVAASAAGLAIIAIAAAAALPSIRNRIGR
jgi:hypothetical protein